MALSKNTKDHDEIRQWAESRGAVPSEVASTHSDGEAGILRFQFPKAKNANDGALREIPWDEFFEKFDENNLSLVYQDKTASGRSGSTLAFVFFTRRLGTRRFFLPRIV